MRRTRFSRSPWRSVFLALLGTVVLIWLLRSDRSGALLKALHGSASSLAWIIPVHAVVIGLDARAWWRLVRGQPEARGVRWSFLLWAALVRDAVANLLPLSRLGGDVVGARLFLARSPSAPLAVAGVTADVATHAMTQALYWALGLAVALRYSTLAENAPLAAGLALLVLGTGAAGLALLRGVPLRSLNRLLQALGLGQPGGLRNSVGAVRRRLRGLSQSAAHIARVCALQSAALALSTSESWLILRALSHPVPLATALVLESLTQGVRGVLSVVPAGLGVQELGLVLGAGAYGIPAPVGIATSLLKRAREMALGVPFLLWWQFWEWRNTLRQPG